MIRRAKRDDAAGIAAIWNHAIRETTITFTPTEKTTDEIANLINEVTPCFVLEVENKLVGFARYFQFRGGDGYRFSAEHTIMLTGRVQGQGHGRALLMALCEHAAQAGMHTMHACISGENSDAIEFHRACGFTALAVLPQVGFKFGRWIDLVLMQKQL